MKSTQTFRSKWCVSLGLLLSISALVLPQTVQADTLLTESFETDGQGTRYDSNMEFTDGSGDYYGRHSSSDTSASLTGADGTYWFGGQDQDDTTDGDGVATRTNTLRSVDITGYTDLELLSLWAEDDDGSNQDWDSTDYVHVQVQIDGGSWTDLLWFESPLSTNGEPMEDTDFDGTGDGRAITSTFQEWTNSITGTGTGLVVRIIASMNSGDEDWAVDNIRVTGTAGTTEPTTHASGLTFSSVGSDGMTISWTSGDGENRIVVVREGSATSWTPTDGVAPSGVDADFSSATDQADGNKICYDGSGDSFDLSGLSASTTYYVTIYEYNGSGTGVDYYTGGTPLSGSQATGSATGIWINPMSAGTPMGTYYLGDTLGDWYVNFEIGQETWDYAQIGLGTSEEGADYNWGMANWYENGEGSNKRVRRNLNGYQYTSTGTVYVICQARANAGDLYTSKSGNGWGNLTAYPPADLASAYFTVEALSDPSSVSAVKDTSGNTATRADLSWTQWDSKNVLITVATDTPTGSPEQGTAYVADDTFGNQTVISGGESGTALEVTGLTPGETYYFTFYSENFSYYSDGVSATALTMGMPQARNTNGGSPEAPTSIFLGDQNLIFGCDTWGTLEGNWGRARMWASVAPWFWPFGDTNVYYGEWGDFTDAEHKNCTPPAGAFHSSAEWIWGIQVDYGEPYGDNFYYMDDTLGDWLDMMAESESSLQIQIYPINDPLDQQVTATDIDQIDLSFSTNAQGNAVMIVRKLATDAWTEPTQGTAYSVSDSLGDGTVIYSGSGPSASATGLSEDTTYDFKLYSVNNDYYSAGVVVQGTTDSCAPDAPIGLSADPSYTDFTASWDEVSGATGYRIDVSTEDDFQSSGNGELFISEVADPSDEANAKYVELYNATGAEIDFDSATWYLSRQANGSSWATVQLTGAIAAGDTFVIAYNTTYDSAFGEAADQYAGGVVTGNGDDGYFLYQDGDHTSGTLVDAYGVIDQDGTGMDWEYTDGHAVRNADVADPNDTWTSSEWTITSGTASIMTPNEHTCTGDTVPSYVPGFENLAVAGTSVSVTGLTEATDYYFRLRAEGQGGCPSADSTTAWTTTLEHLRPVFASTNANVREEGEGRLFVALNKAPSGTIVLSVDRVSGDTGLTVQSGAELTFTAEDWYALQPVTLAAAEDANSVNETAQFEVTGSGLETGSFQATALDIDIGDNIALASGGSTISGKRMYQTDLSIDGVSTDRGSYSYSIWTNDPQGYMTLDLQSVSTISRIRVLNWDWIYRTHTYEIESSQNGSVWTPLVDASAEGHQGWDDWDIADVSARYIRFTGLSNSVNNGICIPEWEVYGTRAPLPQVSFSKTNVLVHENGQGRFYVRLDSEPESDVTLTVSRSSGDEGITVEDGASLTIKTTRWNLWHPVTLAAADDVNEEDETAVIQVTGSRVLEGYLDAVALDDDIGDNLALASSGASLSGFRTYVRGEAIDGIHTDRYNYAYAIWTNEPIGYMVLDLQAPVTLSRIRLLNWDWSYRTHEYTIESSADGDSWSTLIDATGEQHQGWDDWTVSVPSVRYLRFTGIANSVDKGICVSEWEVFGTRPQTELLEFAQSGVNVREGGTGRFYVRMTEEPSADISYTVSRSIGDEGITVQSGGELVFTPANWNAWRPVTLAAAEDADSDGETATFQLVSLNAGTQFIEATALDDEIGENVALASGGATLSGTRAYLLGAAIDGVHDTRSNYEYSFWTGSSPGTMTLDMQEAITVSRIRVRNWDWTYRAHRYTIEASTDGESWSTVADASGEEHISWDDWAVADQSIRYLRFTALSNTANNAVCIPEWEVYGTRPEARRLIRGRQDRSLELVGIDTTSSLLLPQPISVLTSDGTEDDTGWNAVDGDEETAWVGQSVGGGYIVVEYGPNLELDSLVIDVDEDSLTDAEILYSLDAEEWLPLPEAAELETDPVELKFLWILFPDDGSEALPGVIEITPNP